MRIHETLSEASPGESKGEPFRSESEQPQQMPPNSGEAGKVKETIVQIRQTTAGLMESTNQFLQSFDRSRYHLVVIYLKGSLSAERRQRVVADEVIFMHLTDDALKGLKLSATYRVYRLLKKLRPAVLFAHRYHSVWLAGVICRLVKIPTCFAVLHGNTQINRFGRRFFTKLALKERFFFIGISDVVSRDILASSAGLNSNRVISMPNSIDIEAQRESLLPREEARKFLNIPADRQVVGHVARLSPTKNQYHLLRSFAEVLKAVPDVLLVMIGDGKLEKELKALATNLGVSHAVRFLGRVDKASNYMRAFDLFVMTSKDEGFGRVLLEAMTARRPVIATDIPAFAEVMSGSGRLVQLDDVKELSEQIQKHLAMQPEQLEGVLVEQDRVLYEKYSLEKFKNRFNRIYQSILHNRAVNETTY